MKKKIPIKIVVDTREQNPLWKKDVISKKLDVGDYSIEGFEDQIAIERKSLTDLFGTLGKGHRRFNKEIERSKGLEYFAIVIDGTVTNCLLKDFKGANYSRMKGFVILAILMSLHMKHNIPFFFTNGRSESKRIIKELFNAFYRKKGLK